VNVRGVGSSQFSPLGSSAVGFVQDGVPLEGNIGLTSGFFDLERIEVLKGPQGTIYGLDATGGVISVVTARPRIGETSGSISGEYGNYDQLKLEGSVNVPFGTQLAGRISGTYHRRDGYVASTYDDAKEGGIRGQLLYKNGAISLLLAADYFHEGGIGTGAVALPLGRGTPDGDPFHSNFFPNSGTDAKRDNTYWGVRAELNVDLGFATLTVLPAYRKIKTDEIQYMSAYRADVQNDISQTSGEVRLAGKTGGIDWLLGGFALWGKRTYQGFFYSPGPSLLATAPLNSFLSDPAADNISANGLLSKTPKESQAVFGNATFHVSPEFRLVGGLRYSHDKRSVEPNTGYLLVTSAPVPPFAPPSFIPLFQVGGIADRPGESFSLESLRALNPALLSIRTLTVSGSARFSHVDFKVGAQYDVAPDVMAYANLSTGYKSGGVNTYTSGSIGRTYKPETLTALEGGVRAHLGALRLHVNGYYWWYKNHQEGAIYNLPGVGTQLLIENLPAGRMYGVDLEAGWRVTKDDVFGLQVAWLHSDTGPFTVGPSGGLPGSQVVELVGHSYVSAPTWSINGNYEHVFHFGGYELAARGEGHYQSKSNLEIRFLPQTEQPAYFTGNLLLTVRPSSQKWYIGGYIRNVTNETYLVAAQKAPGLIPDMWGNLGAPRTYGVRAGFNF
jgi:iron complex outermembrane receptor protein